MRWLALSLALAAGCPQDAVESDATEIAEPTDEGPGAELPDPPDVETPEWVQWDPDPVSPDCVAGPVAAPLLEQALESTGLTRETFAFSDADLAHSPYEQLGALDDAFRFDWFEEVQKSPEKAVCFGQDRIATLDRIMQGAHPVASMIRHAAILAERWEEAPPLNPLAVGSFEQELQRASIVASPDYVVEHIDLPLELKEALAPVLAAIADGLEAHRAMVQSQSVRSGPAWAIDGGIGTSVSGVFTQLLNEAAVEYLLGKEARPALNLAAARIAWAIEHTDWSAFEGMDAAIDLATPLGWIRVRGPDIDFHKAASEPVLLSVDLGGDDVYLFPVGSTTHGNLGVNIAIDIGGADGYGYEVVPTPQDADWLLPADAGGRLEPDEFYGPIALSDIARQGAARNGIAMLFDLGGDSDTYGSLAKSQGYAHLGVGVLYDDGGDELYEAEAASQGCAAYGIGMLLDAGGDDRYRGVWKVQGSASVGGVAILWDATGDDSYIADPGESDGLGHALYFSPQLPGVGNTSLAQGAASGVRFDEGEIWVSGGIGILRDAEGDDEYLASVFAQGVGFWQGTGVLSDGSGADTYDGYWYVQGAGAHYALGLLLDGGTGDDVHNGGLNTLTMHHGAGHDYSLGVLVNEAGNDTYHFASLAAGASNCNGIGLFVDNGGKDTYSSGSTYNLALGNVSDECVATRPEAVSIGVFLDAGGVDQYDWPGGPQSPANDAAFGHVTHSLDSEHGAGLDATGETGLHAE